MGRVAPLALLISAAFGLLGSGPAQDAAEPAPFAIIDRAFDRMLNYPSVRSVTFHIERGEQRVTRRSFDYVYKDIEGRGHTLLRFSAPSYLRDTSLLMIENDDGSSDTWLYRPGDRRPRRVGTSQKGEAFYGSDFTFEDLEHQDWRRYDLERLPDVVERGRASYVVDAVPQGGSQYSRLRTIVEKESFALLRVDFFRAGADVPQKSMQVELDDLEQKDGVFRPAWIVMQQHGRPSATRVEFKRIERDPAITERVFSTMRLERSGESLYELVDRLRDPAS